jgi:hypothetical protein
LLGKKAKTAAQQAIKQGHPIRKQAYKAKSITLNTAAAKQWHKKTSPEGVGGFSRRMDTALPGRHTGMLYDSFKRREASVLAQLRTGMTRLNAVESGQCACGQVKKTIKHFLFGCIRWTGYRTQMLQQTETKRSNLSFYLGGRAPSDTEP